MPLFERLLIETQANCNRDCWFCPRTFDDTGVYRDASGHSNFAQMPTETVIDLLDQAQGLGFTGLVTFYFFSEPMLDRRNIEFARAARDRGMRPYTHTNGDLLRVNDRLAEAVQDAYEYIVVGLYDYETAEELETDRAWWQRRLPRADLRFSYVRPVVAPGVPTLAIPRALVPTDKRMRIPDLTFANGPCSRPLQRMIVRHDGAMCNCCEDVHAQFGLGNIHESSLEELWFSERHLKVARDLLAGERSHYPLCEACPLMPTGPAPNGAPVDMRRRNYRPERPPQSRGCSDWSEKSVFSS
jgi:radical SAM protein with 4Fe4S-binding SPASM domain